MGLQFEEAILNKPLVGSEEWTSDSKGGGGSGIESGGEVAGVGQSEFTKSERDSGGSSGNNRP